jgi:hypothetical protein
MGGHSCLERPRSLLSSVASWRRSADSEVHVQIESAALSRCGISADQLGERLEEAGQAICDDCAFAVLHDASDAEDCLVQLKTDRTRAPDESLTDSYRAALRALRTLTRTMPSTSPIALLLEAERLLQVGDDDHAFKILREWRVEMRASGLLPSA